MATLRELILMEERRPQVMSDVRNLLDGEVRSKRGVSGLAVKTGYKVVKTFKPGFLDRVIQDLVPDFCDALEPLHERYLAEDSKKTFGEYMRAHESEATQALLGVTDGRAAQSSNRVVKKTYSKLRGSAENHVRQAIPGLAALMDDHYADAVAAGQAAETEAPKPVAPEAGASS